MDQSRKRNKSVLAVSLKKLKLLSQIVCLSWTNGHVVLGNYGTSSQEKLLLQIIVARVTITLFLFVKQSKNDNHMFYCLNKMIGIT